MMVLRREFSKKEKSSRYVLGAPDCSSQEAIKQRHVEHPSEASDASLQYVIRKSTHHAEALAGRLRLSSSPLASMTAEEVISSACT